MTEQTRLLEFPLFISVINIVSGNNKLLKNYLIVAEIIIYIILPYSGSNLGSGLCIKYCLHSMHLRVSVSTQTHPNKLHISGEIEFG